MMQYWNNGDGTYTVKAWEITFDGDHPGYLVYEQSIALDKFAEPGAVEMNLRLPVRDHRPAIGTEISRPGATAPQSGYAHCACRDCMETIVAKNMARPELCDDCHTADCGDPDATTWPECQRDDAYGEC